MNSKWFGRKLFGLIEIISRHCNRESEENHEERKSGQPVSQPKFELKTSRIQVLECCRKTSQLSDSLSCFCPENPKSFHWRLWRSICESWQQSPISWPFAFFLGAPIFPNVFVKEINKSAAYSDLTSLHCVDMGSDAEVSEVHAVSIFRVYVSNIVQCSGIYRFWSKRLTDGRVGAGAWSGPIGRVVSEKLPSGPFLEAPSESQTNGN
jgi:hypothetical protein